MTDAEQLLWKHLRRKQLLSIQFYRQKTILNYIVDFYSAKAKLLIEVDGGQHLENQNLTKDAKRDKDLEELGLTVLWFDNRQVLIETESVLDEIYAFIEKQISPNPSLPKKGTK